MPNQFIGVPDWFSWENEGGGVAAASLAGDGVQDLVVLMVDSPEGKNQGLFRVGRALDGAGAITGGWTPWMAVPEWFSHQNQGAGIALADLGNNGGQDLVVAMVDAPAGKNQGLFRVGRGLDRDGNSPAAGHRGSRSRTGSPTRTRVSPWRWRRPTVRASAT